MGLYLLQNQQNIVSLVILRTFMEPKRLKKNKKKQPRRTSSGAAVVIRLHSRSSPCGWIVMEFGARVRDHLLMACCCYYCQFEGPSTENICNDLWGPFE